ncbi:MAG: 6-hydroxymethylpterin diphosphokinase MptE-like protein [Rhodospirillaceae bacterium]
MDQRSANLKILEQSAPDLFRAVSDLGPGAAALGFVLSDTVDLPARLMISGPNPDKRTPHLSKFAALLVAEAIDRNIPFFDDPAYSLSCCLLTIGTPSTAAVMDAIQRTGCIYLFMAVPDTTHLNAWIDHVRLDEITDRVRRYGGEVFFLQSSDPVRIVGDVFTGLSSTAPSALDGLSIAAYSDQALARSVADQMGQLGFHALSTVGTFYDQCLMLKNSDHNLRRGNAFLYSNRTRLAPDMAALIVGSGPSLDNDLPFIARHQDKAVIISCGSALAPLLAAGIKPDFHVELENVNVSPTLLPAVENHDVSGITLVAPATVDPIATKHFDRVIFSFRPNLSNLPLLGLSNDTVPVLAEPTVVNLGLAFARERDFPEIVFFGTDMGVRSLDSPNDHAQGTWHTEEDSGYEYAEHEIQVPANFGGTSYTTRGLFQALHVVSLAVANDPSGRHYINCSDGAEIAGAMPKHSREMSPQIPKTAKPDLVAQIIGEFEPWDPEKIPNAWPGPDLVALIKDKLGETQRDLRGIRNFADKSYIPQVCMPYDFAKGHLYPAPPGIGSVANMLVRGTVGALILFMEYYLNRVARKEDIYTVGDICVRVICEILDDLMAEADDRLSGSRPENIPAYEDLPEPPEKSFPPLPTMPRNAECPCGSGKRFKNCHGAAA